MTKKIVTMIPYHKERRMSKRERNSRGKCNYSKIDRKLHNKERNILINEAQHDRKYKKKT